MSGPNTCICGKPDVGELVIACQGGCERWHHFQCIKMTEREADSMKKYVSGLCESERGIRTIYRRL